MKPSFSFLVNLRSLLDSYCSQDAQEQEYQSRILELLQHEEKAVSRSFFCPGHITVSSFLVDSAKTQCLLIFHKKLQRWLQPGGHVEPEDTSVMDTACREVLEEVGLGKEDIFLCEEGLFDLDIHWIPENTKEAGHFHFDIRLLFQTKTEVHVKTQDDGILDIRWFWMNDISTLDTDDSVKRVLNKIKRLVQN